MTLDDIITNAQLVVQQEPHDSRAHILASAILSLLPSDAGCGAVEPEVVVEADGRSFVRIPDEWPGVYTAEETRGLARMLIEAAERCEGGSNGR